MVTPAPTLRCPSETVGTDQMGDLTDWMVFTAGTVIERGVASGATGTGGGKLEVEAIAVAGSYDPFRSRTWLLAPLFFDIDVVACLQDAAR